ncbi:hypothetical protein [Campylobacter mucosalis]|uniref:hypothetical protein n=1 Tax=Campylobacter mucosalis TaxID=202 RepID=UPI0014706F15|nr:hypothetical protein [Campylobacter mucosalis]
MLRYAFVILALVVLFVALWAIKDEKLNKKNKVLLTALAFLAMLFAYFFQSVQDDKHSENLELLKHFKQGKVLVCSDINVTNTKFNYEFGTSCFLPKREFKELNGLVLKISDCKVLSD